MKVVILAGGMGTRISEETQNRPKPLIEIGGYPILWHIMKIYSHYGFNDFVICLGYKGYLIKEYFYNYNLHMSDVTIDIQSDEIEVHQKHTEPWSVSLIDTGLNTKTGSRIRQIAPYTNNETFMLTYGDGVADINISKLLNYHGSHDRIGTVTTVKPIGRFGTVQMNDSGAVTSFMEKPTGGWVNGGFFVFKSEIFKYLAGDSMLEVGPLEKLAEDGQLMANRHTGFWHAMDTLRDKNNLESLWQQGAPWKIW